MTQIMLNVMLGVMLIFAAIIFIDPLKDMTDIGREALSCADTSNATTGERMTCIVLDAQLFLFIGACCGVALAVISAKRAGLLGGG